MQKRIRGWLGAGLAVLLAGCEYNGQDNNQTTRDWHTKASDYGVIDTGQSVLVLRDDSTTATPSDPALLNTESGAPFDIPELPADATQGIYVIPPGTYRVSIWYTLPDDPKRYRIESEFTVGSGDAAIVALTGSGSSADPIRFTRVE